MSQSTLSLEENMALSPIWDPETTLKYKRLSVFATIPIRHTGLSAGMDLCSAVNCIIMAGSRRLVFTDLAFTFPSNCYGRIAGRSGLALVNGINVLAGVIDADYTGNIGVILINHSDTDFEVRIGDCIAQIISTPCVLPDICEIVDLPTTKRKGNGFGSSDSGKRRKLQIDSHPLSVLMTNEEFCDKYLMNIDVEQYGLKIYGERAEQMLALFTKSFVEETYNVTKVSLGSHVDNSKDDCMCFVFPIFRLNALMLWLVENMITFKCRFNYKHEKDVMMTIGDTENWSPCLNQMSAVFEGYLDDPDNAVIGWRSLPPQF